MTKSVAHEASTTYAQGGISAVISQLDTVDEHVNDTVVAGDYLCDEKAVRALCTDGKSATKVGGNRDEIYQGRGAGSQE